MVSSDFFQHILRGPREDIYTRLADTLVGDRFSHGEDLREAEEVLHEVYRSQIRELQKQSPTPLLADLLLWRQDLRGLKNYIKRQYFDLDVSAVSSRYDDEQWDRLWEGLETDLPPIFGGVLNRLRDSIEPSPEEPQVFDAAFDSATLRALGRIGKRFSSEWMNEYWKRLDAVRGVEFLLRGQALGMEEEALDVLLGGREDRKLFVALREESEEEWPRLLRTFMPGIEDQAIVEKDGTERIRAFVHAGDRWVMDHVRDGRFFPFGAERVFACMVGLEAEGYNMGVSVVGRANDVAADQLSEHGRACYV